MQKGQISAIAAPSSMSPDISCLPVSTAGARNFREQFLQVTDFCNGYFATTANIALISNDI